MTDYITLPPRANDLTGKRFGRLVALGPIRIDWKRSVVWRCRCDCGTEVSVSTRGLRPDRTRSCGCLTVESTIRRNTKHGMSHTSIHNTWKKLINRCTCPTNDSYKNYGARGISVCEAWRQSFDNFHFYVAQLPHYGEKGYSIDRVNNDGNYEPGNMRWATRSEQSRNRRPRHLWNKSVHGPMVP